MTDVDVTERDDEGLGATLRTAIRRIAATDALLVALDFDGTLAREVDDPLDARPIPSAVSAIKRLVDSPLTTVALVSGRGIANLASVSEAPDAVLLVGSHGVEFHHDGQTGLVLDAHEQSKLETLRSALDRIANEYAGVRLEVKPVGFALHTRVATSEHATEAASRSRAEAVAAVPDLTIRSGKHVVEFSVRGTTKGTAIKRLRQLTGATAVLFAGDDVTDEDAFSVLGPGDLSLKCGPGATNATYRVATPELVASALHVLADLRV